MNLIFNQTSLNSKYLQSSKGKTIMTIINRPNYIVSERIQDGGEVFASVKEQKFHGAKITLYTVMIDVMKNLAQGSVAIELG